MKAVADERGVIAAAAMDQRGSLQKALAKEKGGDVSDAMMEEFKVLVTEVLTPHASAILLDPEWGLPASKRRAKNAGPAAGVREDRLRQDRPGRLPDLLDDWSVRRLKEAGADCIKILLYYTPFDPKASTTRSTRGSSGSATSAAPTTSRSSSSSSATKKAPTRRASSSRRRSRRS